MDSVFATSHLNSCSYKIYEYDDEELDLITQCQKAELILCVSVCVALYKESIIVVCEAP